jgi:hypothetical protein
MSTRDRFQYLSATSIDQEFLDECADNLVNQLEMACDIETPTGTIHVSDRHKYVVNGGVGTFYEALVEFPTIGRTVGEWLTGTVEFSTLEIGLSNVDGRFNDLLPGGSAFGSWIGNSIEVKVGLREAGSTYTTIFSGVISEVSGVGRTVKTIQLNARDRFDILKQEFPTELFTLVNYPQIDERLLNNVIPVIYGDWTAYTTASGGPDENALVPAFVTNGADPNVIGGARNNVRLKISANALKSFDTARVEIVRGNLIQKIPASDIVNVNGDNNEFEIVQNGALVIDDGPYEYTSSDQFYVFVRGKDLGAYDNNAVAIARDILETYAGVSPADIDASWDTYRDKSAPAQDAISSIFARAWIQEQVPVLDYALSILEQVRLEAFIDRARKLKIKSFHYGDWNDSPTFTVKNQDVAKDSLQISIDYKNNFNRSQGNFRFSPKDNENTKRTAYYRNQDAIDAAGKTIGKLLVYPNLVIESEVDLQVQETLRFSSAYIEILDLQLTWRALLLDIGDFLNMQLSIGSTIFNNTPAYIRSIGYDPNGLKLPITVFSLQMFDYGAYTPSNPGATSSQTQTIIKE